MSRKKRQSLQIWIHAEVFEERFLNPVLQYDSIHLG